MIARRRRRVAALCSVSLLALGTQACGGADDDSGDDGDAGGSSVVEIGLLDSMSGDLLPVVKPMDDGVRLAVQEINDAGGITIDGNKMTIKLVEVDDKSTPEGAVAGAQQLVNDDQVKFIFGPLVSAAASQAKEITGSAGVINISPAGSWQDEGVVSSDDTPLLFSTQPPVEDRAQMLLDGMQDLGATSVAILSQDDASTAGNAEAYQETLNAAGIETDLVRFPPDVPDLKPYLTRIKRNNPDVMLYFFPQTRAVEALTGAEELGVATKAYATLNLSPSVALNSNPDHVELSKPLFSGLAYPSIAYPTTDELEAFRDKVLEFDPDIPQGTIDFIFYSYDIVYMLAQAMEDAGTVDDLQSIADSLQSAVYDGVGGTVCWSQDARIVKYDQTIIMVDKGEITDSRTVPSGC